MMKLFYFTLGFPFLAFLVNLVIYFFKAQTKEIFLPIFAASVVLLNGFLFLYTFKKDRHLAYFFQGSALLVQVLVFIYETIL
uniref:Uncharacterized protein n=1 Tax=candidate division CPR3 bacterium TaxID=2268181 RepID=A0A7V3N4W3_UNCC3